MTVQTYVFNISEKTELSDMYLCLLTRVNVLSIVSVLDVQVLLMTDILVFLQEKDQRFIFASLVNI